jgi:hypothetical protein
MVKAMSELKTMKKVKKMRIMTERSVTAPSLIFLNLTAA